MGDLVRSYLRDIGRVPLLSHEQEITLGRQVQEYVQVERAEIEIMELTDTKPSAEELAEKLNLSTSQIKKRLRAGQRAKKKKKKKTQGGGEKKKKKKKKKKK